MQKLKNKAVKKGNQNLMVKIKKVKKFQLNHHQDILIEIIRQ